MTFGNIIDAFEITTILDNIKVPKIKQNEPIVDKMEVFVLKVI